MTSPPFASALACLLLSTAAGIAQELDLALPIECSLGETCFVQNHVDADPGPGARDFACGNLTYDGHKGTDFALPSFSAMSAGMPVLAAAPGIIRATRDSLPDTGLGGTPSEILDGKECGNGVVVDHGGGWETQYCHMKRGTVAVRPGDLVQTGSTLGEVGYSGRTEAPHLHFALRKDGAVIDPFDPDADGTCDADRQAQDPMWLNAIAYVPGGLVAVGAAPAVPAYDEIKAGGAAHPTLPADAPALVGWAYFFGAKAGDLVEITLHTPDGREHHHRVVELGRPLAQGFRATGKRRPPGGWPAGIWRISARLLRDGVMIDHGTAEVDLVK